MIVDVKKWFKVARIIVGYATVAIFFVVVLSYPIAQLVQYFDVSLLIDKQIADKQRTILLAVQGWLATIFGILIAAAKFAQDRYENILRAINACLAARKALTLKSSTFTPSSGAEDRKILKSLVEDFQKTLDDLRRLTGGIVTHTERVKFENLKALLDSSTATPPEIESACQEVLLIEVGT